MMAPMIHLPGMIAVLLSISLAGIIRLWTGCNRLFTERGIPC